MKYTLLSIILLFTFSVKLKAQDSPETALQIPSFNSGTVQMSATAYAGATPGINYDCLGNTHNYEWFYMAVCDSQNFQLRIPTIGLNESMGYVIYGPLNDTTQITNQLTGVNPVSCGVFSTTSTHFITFNNTSKGIYYFAIAYSNFQNSAISVSTNNPAEKFCTLCNNSNQLDQRICLISLDSATNKNKIIFDKGDTTNINGYVVYRENTITNKYDSMKFISVDSANYFIDMTANPASRSWKYRMLRYDKCGNTLSASALLNYHLNYTTIFLQQGASSLNAVNLSWNNTPNPGNGPFVQSVYIYRRDNGGIFQILDTVPFSATAYTDNNPAQGLNEYQISIRQTTTCNTVNRSTAYTESLSNIISTVFTGIDEVVSHNYFTVYPNPASAETTIDISNMVKSWKLSVIAIDGKSFFVKEGNSGGKTTINTMKLAKGFYTIKLNADGKDYYKQLIIQ